MSPLEEAIDNLRRMTAPALRAEWRRVYRIPAPGLSADLLMRGIAWRLQEKAHGGLNANIERQLLRRADGGEEQPVQARVTKLKAGAQLVRSWRGKTHSVIVTEDGFLWNGTCYGSLTGIASAITGTHWSGPRFFGLTNKKRQVHGAA